MIRFLLPTTRGFRGGAGRAAPLLSAAPFPRLPPLFWRILQKIYKKNTFINERSNAVFRPLFPELGSRSSLSKIFGSAPADNEHFVSHNCETLRNCWNYVSNSTACLFRRSCVRFNSFSQQLVLAALCRENAGANENFKLSGFVLRKLAFVQIIFARIF